MVQVYDFAILNCPIHGLDPRRISSSQCGGLTAERVLPRTIGAKTTLYACLAYLLVLKQFLAKISVGSQRFGLSL